MQTEQATELHPIACENCRNKKSKCSRTIPACAQCTASGASCRYPNGNKRGIPPGYISVLEKRLLETELVLFESLCALYASPVQIEPFRSSQAQREAIAEFSYKQSKTEKLEEWNTCSLGADCDRMSWWQKRCEVTGTLPGISAPPNPSNGVELGYQHTGDLASMQVEHALNPQDQRPSNANTTSPAMILPVHIQNPAPRVEQASVIDAGQQWRRYF
ncbi:hypothetical protein DM02DRAFT_675568 [Periconia macrospinosa]|uniref:Zn(2)-C6 fungal-type domain-containing protein n=1 Tax=Periconia macrospinosa TaxID=97972 RepID=A0A2V1DBA1_9PLEO|nr:hypothetical protein DM02DRAFT_675568 [Periconia macrospinosa]